MEGELTKEYLHVFGLRHVMLTLHRQEIQWRFIQAGIEIGRELRIAGLSGSETFLARPSSGGNGDGGGVVEMRRHGGPDVLVEAVVVAEEEVVAAEAAVVLAGNLKRMS